MQLNKTAAYSFLLIIAVVVVFKAGIFSFNNPSSTRAQVNSDVSPSPSVYPKVAVGSMAPDFTLTDTDGKQFSLKYMIGKPIILFGMASWCGECIGEGQDLTKIQQTYGDKAQIIGVAFTQGDTKDTIMQFKQIGKVNIPLALDTDNVTQKYHLVNLDSTYFINKQGVISYISNQAMNYQDIKEQLDKIL